MRPQVAFSLVVIVVLGVAAWVGPASPLPLFNAAAQGFFDASITNVAPGSLTPTLGSGSTTTPLVPNPPTAAAYVTTWVAPAPAPYYVQAIASGDAAGLVLPASTSADAYAWVSWSVANNAGSPPLNIQPTTSSLFGDAFALAGLPGFSASALSELILTLEVTPIANGLGLSSSNGNGSPPELCHETWSQTSGGALVHTGSCSGPFALLVLLPGNSVTFTWTAHSYGTALADVVTPAPMPATLALLGSGLAGLGILAWRRRR
jgi:hypothetical protein